ncbi:MAG: hypothetical protein IBX72_02650 [Nitrospirae bacterium]|nr:hypothetical protein [Nitrospirota bacterium]
MDTGIDDKDLFIKIRDTGSGISQVNLSKILDPFFTTGSEKGGIGPGVSIAKKVDFR